MKKTTFHRFLLASAVALGLTACSKDQADIVDNSSTSSANTASASTARDPNPKGDPGTEVTGAVSGRIEPAQSAAVNLYSSTKTYGPFYTDPQTGYFKTSGVAAGTYKLVAWIPGESLGDPQDAMTSTSMDVTVTENQITDVGVIRL